MSYAEGTSVPVERSRAEIEQVLSRYGASSFVSGWDQHRAVLGFTCKDRQVRFVLPLPKKDDERFTHRKDKGWAYARKRTEADAKKLYEQECRRLWRALALTVKAKLEAVQSGIATFDQEFLAHIVLPGGRTVGDMAIPQLADAYETGAASSLPLLGSGRSPRLET